MDYLSEVCEAKEYIEQHLNLKPEIALILGSGLGDLAEEIQDAIKIPYEQIPHFPLATVEGHAGQLVLGKLQGRDVVVLQGRFHYYEGYTMREVVFPVYVLSQLGVKLLVVTNACGGMNPRFAAGDLMLITDHLNFTGENPLIGFNHEQLGSRFPDMSTTYTPHLVDFVEQLAREIEQPIHKGVYVGITGPSYMTNGELSMLAQLGGDVLGMSTVPEVIAASHTGLEVLGISCITDMAIGGQVESISHEQVIEMANQTKPAFTRLLKEVIAKVKLNENG